MRMLVFLILFSWFLRRLHPEPLVSVHPELAEARKFCKGDAVAVVTPSGRARFILHIDDGLQPDVVLSSEGTPAAGRREPYQR
jgi:anaerobic selenocysteine-containing dehydrogenase